jgi:hypothetical protein
MFCLEKQRNLLLPTPYFLVTFTLPGELRSVARSNQKPVYNLLFKASAAALQKLARDPRFVGGQIRMMGGLHTWRRDLGYHPHVHFIVPGGGLSPDCSQWLPADSEFLVPVEALSVIFRAKFRDGLKKTDLFNAVPAQVWKTDWVVHCKPVGSGNQALKYLAPYVYRVAITNNRITKLENGRVSFRFKNSGTQQWETARMPALSFIHRFLKHVPPKGFVKIRYYGFLSPGKRNLLSVIKYLLGSIRAPDVTPAAVEPYICPDCGAKLIKGQSLPKITRPPP